MNVKKMMSDWDNLNRKALTLSEVKEEEKGSETSSTEPTPTPSIEPTSTPSTEPTPTPSTEPTSSTPESTSSTHEEPVDAEGKSDALFEKLEKEFKSITVEEKEQEKKEAKEAEDAAVAEEAAEATPSSSTLSVPSTSTPAPIVIDEKETKEITIERELLLYLENNKDRYKAFSSHSQEYAQGKITAFMYYYLIGKTFGDGLVPIVLPLVLKALEGNPKKQEALKCYHQFAISKSCGLCKKWSTYQRKFVRQIKVGIDGALNVKLQDVSLHWIYEIFMLIKAKFIARSMFPLHNSKRLNSVITCGHVNSLLSL